ncbi:transporter [Streptomyces chrestomyceticus JCM 4735]|uniref:Transporter n=1 Tax=Streptomyces chrestomyceticus JCM 4735 TaxID=1306181 RepID=A0A7U9Q2M3_9ACTN|nr:ABC transporter permease subunit [Streptomyces chrestomyceticus]GCD39640.1 transporter [Streptomyces chrestomyceticus JCM 4735]
MIWLTWRQLRVHVLVALAALAATALLLLVTGLQLRHSYDTDLAGCATGCGAAEAAFLSRYAGLSYLATGLVIAVPGLLGVFWGAPLIAREVEAGTHRLVWNQSVTRTRWLAVKLATVGLAAVAVTGLLSLLVTWWAGPLDQVAMDRFSPLLFSARGIVPLGYAAFAFTVGACAGLLIRRTVPAMAVTLAVFAAVQVLLPVAVRPYLQKPVHTDVALDLSESTSGRYTLLRSGSGAEARVDVEVSRPGDWVVSGASPVLDRSGRDTGRSLACAEAAGCTVPTDLHTRIAYQPAERYWAFQWSETAICLALAGLTGGFCAWWLRRRRS